MAYFQPIGNIVDLNDASTTLQEVGGAAQPLFASTIAPAAFMEGILIGGVVVAALIVAVKHAVQSMFYRDEFMDRYHYVGPGSQTSRYLSMHGDARTYNWVSKRWGDE